MVTSGQAPIPCKVCDTPAPHWDTCDFNTHCMRLSEPDLPPPAGIAVAYHRCPACGFLFTPYMDDFTPVDFSARVYNADYHLFDPGFEEERPADIETRGMAWWYCTPRNGHISLHTNASLDHLADQADIALLSLTPRAMRRSWPGFKQSQRCRP